MNDDFNTPIVISHLFEAVRVINSANEKLIALSAEDIKAVQELFDCYFTRVMGLRDELSDWLAQHAYASVAELIGCMAQQSAPDPGHYERTPYLRSLTSFRPLEAMRSGGPW